jgi:hypothetical protein
MTNFALDLEDEADLVMLFVFGAIATWLAWAYWPPAHDALACVFGR